MYVVHKNYLVLPMVARCRFRTFNASASYSSRAEQWWVRVSMIIIEPWLFLADLCSTGSLQHTKTTYKYIKLMLNNVIYVCMLTATCNRLLTYATWCKAEMSKRVRFFKIPQNFVNIVMFVNEMYQLSSRVTDPKFLQRIKVSVIIIFFNNIWILSVGSTLGQHTKILIVKRLGTVRQPNLGRKL